MKADKLFQNLMAVTSTFSKEFLTRAAAIVEQELYNAAPAKTEALRASIYTIAGSERAEVVAGSNYALFVDQGSRPHIIQGRPLLVFDKGGDTVFTHKVNHPGYSGAHFASRALLAAAPQIAALINSQVIALLE